MLFKKKAADMKAKYLYCALDSGYLTKKMAGSAEYKDTSLTYKEITEKYRIKLKELQDLYDLKTHKILAKRRKEISKDAMKDFRKEQNILSKRKKERIQKQPVKMR